MTLIYCDNINLNKTLILIIWISFLVPWWFQLALFYHFKPSISSFTIKQSADCIGRLMLFKLSQKIKLILPNSSFGTPQIARTNGVKNQQIISNQNLEPKNVMPDFQIRVWPKRFGPRLIKKILVHKYHI